MREKQPKQRVKTEKALLHPPEPLKPQQRKNEDYPRKKSKQGKILAQDKPHRRKTNGPGKCPHGMFQLPNGYTACERCTQ